MRSDSQESFSNNQSSGGSRVSQSQESEDAESQVTFQAPHKPKRRLCCKACAAACSVFVVFLLALLSFILWWAPSGSLAWLQQERPGLHGPHVNLGSLRGRLPSVPNVSSGRPGLLVQLTYPANMMAPELTADRFVWFRPEVITRLASSYGIPQAFMHAVLGSQVQIDPPRTPQAHVGGWPVVVFSSGIFGSAEMYTQLCRELASMGAVVVAVEHEDGSGVFATDVLTQEPIEYIQPPDDVGIVEFRRPFLDQRVNELNATISSIVALALGDGDDETDISLVLRLANPHQIVHVGHSFGSASVFHYLQSLRQLPAANQSSSHPLGALLLDLWAESLAEPNASWTLPVPIALLNSEEFATSELEVPLHQKITTENPQNTIAFTYFRGTFHQWVSDSHLFLPAWTMKAIGFMGSGNYEETNAATMSAVQETVRTFLHPNPELSATALAGKLVQINPNVVVNQDVN